MKKQFLLFAGNDYYPYGGAYDYKGSFKTIEEAVSSHNPNEHDYNGGWANVFELPKEKIVMQFKRGGWHKGDKKID